MTKNIPYDTLRANYAPSTPSHAGYVSLADLYRQIGWDEFISNPNYQNTCAIRVSLALVKSGYPLTAGSHRILSGPHKGKRVQVSMTKLADLLATPAWLGKPEILSAQNPASALRARRGIIAFHGIAGYAGGGHIDLIDNSADALNCASACYFGAKQVWFWPLARSPRS